MTLIFHDLKSIIEVFLDGLAAHSHNLYENVSFLPFDISAREVPPLFGQVKSSQVHLLHEVWSLIRVHCLQRGYKSQPFEG